MKKRFFDPGFEFLFTTGILAALVLPQLIFAQSKKDIKEISITIKGNDTTFNGKDLKEMSASERQQALAEIGKTVRPKGRMMHQEIAMEIGPDSNKAKYFSFRMDPPMHFNNDMERDMYFRAEAPSRRMENFSFNDRPVGVRGMRRENTQEFDHKNVDKDGITTRVRYRVAEPFMDITKKVAGVNKSDLDLQDLTLTPQFSAGKTILSFTLPVKTQADIQFTDGEGKAMWKDKTSATAFTKSFTWGMNGIYYLVVKQGGKTAVKQIVKE